MESKTFWGLDFDKDTEEDVKILLGETDVLQLGGLVGNESIAREAAIDILDDPSADGLNARQLMVQQKEAFDSGIDPESPTAQSIEQHEVVQEEARGPLAPGSQRRKDTPNILQTVLGDSSHTAPNKWWASLGGFGVW